MLYLMRKHAGSWLIKILLGAIVAVFVLWGVGSFRSQRASRVAVVNGETITLDEYNENYRRMIDQLRQQFGDRLNDDLIKLFQVKKQTLDQLIDKRLLLKEAHHLKFRVSDAELAQAIRSIDAFQTGGVFNSAQYRNVLSRSRMNPEDFEVFQRENILIEKVRNYIEGQVRVSAAEIQEWYNWQNAAVDIDYVLFDPSRYKNIAPSEDELKTFYEKTKQAYKTEPEIKVRYLSFTPAAYSPLVRIDENELKEYYDANPEKFKMPKTVEARHILIKAGQDESEKKVTAAKQKALAVLKEARAGKDFSELAKTYSEGPTGENGGYLGTFKKEDMVKPFADQAFSMQAGDISEPVRTQFGWHIIKVEKVNPAGDLSFAEAREDISQKLTEDKARLLAYDAAEAAYNTSYEEDDLAKTATALKLTAKTTGFFNRRGPQEKGLENALAFAAAAFKLSLNEISDVQEFGGAYYLLQRIDEVPEKVPPLADIRSRVTADWVKEKQKERAVKEAGDLLSILKNGEDIEQAVKKFKLTVEQTGYFKRNQSVPKIGFEQGVIDAAFGLSEKKKYPDQVISGGKGSYVIRLRGRKVPGLEGFDQEKKQIAGNLLQNKKFKAFAEWLAKIRESSEIFIEEEFRG